MKPQSLPEDIRNQIKEAIACFDPAQVILFGSYAMQSAQGDSDIDLYVVDKKEEIPDTFQERMRLHRQYAAALRELMRKMPIDLIVHTQGMSREFEAMGSSFSREIFNRGIRLI
jgi:predicted nucleotidyltransferase